MQSLVRREYSRAELHAKLLPHVTPDDNLDAVLDELVARGWLSDTRAAEQMVRTRRSRFGTQRIAHELKQKGISDDLISAALPQLKQGELEAAREVWQKNFASLPKDQREKAKQMRFLQSRSFSLDVVFKVLRADETED